MFGIMPMRDLLRHGIVVALAMCSGYLGAALRDWTRKAPPAIRAERFEVVGQSGNVLGYFGQDSDTRMHNVLLVLLDPRGVRRCEVGVGGNYDPHLLFYDKNGPPDKPERYDSQPRISIGLGWSGSPTLAMRGTGGDEMRLGAIHGDVYGEPELGWGLSFRAWTVPATADIGYFRWWDGSYRSSITLANGAGKHWQAIAGDALKPLPIVTRPQK
jgi:hypothetical protein